MIILVKIVFNQTNKCFKKKEIREKTMCSFGMMIKVEDEEEEVQEIIIDEVAPKIKEPSLA